ncbi:hypothetical protein [Poseidonibacter ostreae]|uniref:hypothetical protein n=1 Tax=Poseidonibacter ostreae TaxID=2654171 RepID=UPI00186B19C3|nr:hypothetical protein [Poseidonibacter ostreae]
MKGKFQYTGEDDIVRISDEINERKFGTSGFYTAFTLDAMKKSFDFKRVVVLTSQE